MKRRTVSMCLVVLCVMLFAFFASAHGENMLTGVSYNPCTYEILDESFQVEITGNGENPIVSFLLFDDQVTIPLSQKQNGNPSTADEGTQYEGYFLSKEVEYYAWIIAFDDQYMTGLIREIDNEENLQIAFAASADTSTKEQLTNALRNEYELTLEQEEASAGELALNAQTLHAAVFANIGDYFAEGWVNVDYNANEKIATVTMYNINTGIPGDGCYLRKYNEQNVVYTLWSSPNLPPQGLQYVQNATYHISWDYTGMLDVTVSGLKVIDNIPFVGVYGDDVKF